MLKFALVFLSGLALAQIQEKNLISVGNANKSGMQGEEFQNFLTDYNNSLRESSESEMNPIHKVSDTTDLNPSNDFTRFVKNLGYNISVFGSNFFKQSQNSSQNALVPVNPDYMLNPGDELQIRIWGSFQSQQKVVVDRDSKIFINQVGSVSVAGVKFRDLDEYLKRSVGKYFKGFEIQASLGKLKGLQVYLTGMVKNPGVHSLSSTSTMVNLLLKSGGISAQGSLRNIELRRGGIKVGTFDLYKLLLNGDKNSDLSLMSGDVIFIPPVKKQIAILNGVQNPAIYEFKDDETLYDIIQLLGGISKSTQTRYFHSEKVVQDSGLKVVMPSFADSGKSYKLSEGEIISFEKGVNRFENAVTLRGHVQNPRRFPFTPGMKIKDLIPNRQSLVTDEYWSNQNKSQDSLVPSFAPSEDHMSVNWDYAVIERFNEEKMVTELIPFQLGKVILENDESQNIELKSGDIVTIFNAKDMNIPIEKRPIYVTIEGEVSKVGNYKLKFGQTLHDVINMAGGVTPNAYVFGTQFTRVSTAKMQKLNYDRVLDEMERQFENSVSTQLSNAGGAEQLILVRQQVEAQRSWFQKLRHFVPTGRMVMELDAQENLKYSELPNVRLENGDKIIIPPVPSAISVFGEVAVQNAFFYKKGNNVGDYVSKAGGATRYADESSNFVMRADGSIISEQDYGFLFWQLPSLKVMPGDVIFVPKQLEFSHWMAYVKDLSQVLANFGLSAAAIVTLMNAGK